MTLLQVFNRYIERGGEEAAFERISASLARRHSVAECLFDSKELGPLRGPAARAMAVARMAWNPEAARRLRECLDRTRPQALVLHNLFPVGSPAVLHAAQQASLPTIWYMHNFRPFSVNGYLWANDRIAPAGLEKNFLPEILAGSWQNSRLRTAVLAAILSGMHAAGMFRRITAWIAISDFLRDKFIQAGIPAEKVFTLRHAWTPMPECLPTEDAGHYLYLGRLITAKGVRVLFEAWDRLAEQRGARAPRLVIGGDGPLRSEVERRAKENPRIDYVGVVAGTEKDRLLRSCRAMVAPSIWWEGLGLVTYEAYDYGKPMLAAHSGGLSETVAHGETGFLHEPGNADELASQVLQLEEHPDARIRMGKKGRDWLLAHASESSWLDRFDAVLAHACKDTQQQTTSAQ